MKFIQWSNPSAEYYRRVYELLTRDYEQIEAFGLEWLREKLHHKNRTDFRLETTLQMLQRHGVIDGNVGANGSASLGRFAGCTY